MTEAGPSTNECVHRWLLSTPGRDVTAGVCAHCGEERGFTGANKQRPGTVWRKGPTTTTK
jgi:hypothetical protein